MKLTIEVPDPQFNIGDWVVRNLSLKLGVQFGKVVGREYIIYSRHNNDDITFHTEGDCVGKAEFLGGWDYTLSVPDREAPIRVPEVLLNLSMKDG